jgi:hypothetical protein
MKITIDGQYRITQQNRNHSRGSLYISNGIGSATLKLISIDNEGVQTDLIDGVLSDSSQYELNHGQNSNVHLVVNGADGTTSFTAEYKGW